MKKMKETYKEHKKDDIKANFAIVSVSSSRTIKEDDAGDLMVELIEKEGHKAVFRTLVKDDKTIIQDTIKQIIEQDVDVIVTSGGTGLGKKDVTIEALKPSFEKEIQGFSILFMTLGFDDVGTPAMLSRATAGIVNGKVIFCIPGSPKACKLALKKLIIPEVGHIIKHIKE